MVRYGMCVRVECELHVVMRIRVDKDDPRLSGLIHEVLLLESCGAGFMFRAGCSMEV